jgi:hypothetical protein
LKLEDQLKSFLNKWLVARAASTAPTTTPPLREKPPAVVAAKLFPKSFPGRTTILTPWVRRYSITQRRTNLDNWYGKIIRRKTRGGEQQEQY